ncbi:MAG: 30S ribosome-binding factor RbfA [Mariniblastus sp.]|nr:30S ribosome-binding factor RbfA [Mariniblastus sp.]
MSSRRVLKAAQAIREVVSMAILTDLKDPRVNNVTVTFVEVSADLRHAKIHVSVMGDEKKQELCLKGLRHASGFLQQRVGNRIDTRYTPRVQFVLDKGIENATAVTRILNEVLPKEPETTDDGEPDEPEIQDVTASTAKDPENESP